MMIPPERALVCAHPTLQELPATTFSDLQHPAIGCPVCRWRVAIPIPLQRFAVSPSVSPEYRYYERQGRMDAYVAFCIGLTFGERCPAHIRWTRLVHRMTTRETH